MADLKPAIETPASELAHDEQQRDVARIHAELAGLNDGTDPFVAAVRATRMPMTITDPRKADNPIVYANDAFCNLTGYSREECLGRNCRFLQGSETNPDDIAKIRDAVDKKEQLEIDIRNHRKDGSVFWNRLLIAPIVDSDGSLAYFFASQFDVTRERDSLAARERELADAHVQLRDGELERARVEEALRQSHKLEAVGQLTGGIAHDFNNMLQAIGSALELMQRRIEQGRAAETAHFVSSARSTVDRAAALTNRLLAFARRQTLQPRRVVMDTLIMDMVEVIRRTVGQGVEVKLRMHDGAWTAMCDPNQLQSALLNAALNARDAMPEGGILTITTKEVVLSATDMLGYEAATPGPYIELSVADTGIGMDHATKSRAFEPFFTTKPLGQGTGLGLSQVYGFVRQSHGSARIDSAPGQGTVLRLYFPREGQVEHGDAQAAAPTRSEQAPGAAADSAAVLLVDDEAVVRAMAAEQLRELGYAVIEAEDGDAALGVLRSGRQVDVLVTDVGLPGGLNGRQVAEAARQSRPGLPVLFMTGYAAGVLDEQLAAGMQIIGKPFGLGVLATRVRDMLAADD